VKYINPTDGVDRVPDPTPQTFTFNLGGKVNSNLTTVQWSKAALYDPQRVITSSTTYKKVNNGAWQLVSRFSRQTFTAATNVRYKVIYSVRNAPGYTLGIGNVKAGSSSGGSNYGSQTTIGYANQTKTIEISVNTAGKSNIYFTGTVEGESNY
jgi:hypothetical protein